MEEPNGTIRNILGGVIFREPIIISNIPRLVPGWNKPIIIGRHAFGDQYRATDFVFEGRASSRVSFTPDDGSEPLKFEVFDAPGDGIAMVQYNHDESIRDFARASLNYGLSRNYPVYLSTKNTILKAYDGRFKDIFQEIFDTEFKEQFDAAGLTYEHRLIDDMVASAMKWEGGYVWACKNYDGDVQSDTVAQGFGSLGLMTSVLSSPTARSSRRRPRTAPSRATTASTRQGKPTSHEPDRLDLRVDPRPAHRAKLDGNPALATFAETLEDVVIKSVESRPHDEGPRGARRTRPEVGDHRGVPRHARQEPRGATRARSLELP